MQEFAQMIAEAVDAKERSGGQSPPTSTQQNLSGQRSGSSSLEGSIDGSYGVPKFNFLGFDPEKTRQREQSFIDEQRAADGLLPTYFGGKIGWQQINKMAIESYRKGGLVSSMASALPGADGLYSAALWADQNPIVVQSAIDHSRRAFRAVQAFNQEQGDFGQRLGQFPGQGDFSSIGPFRPPLINPSARAGTAETIDAFVTGAMKPGIGRDDIKDIKANLADTGFYPGDPDRDRLETVLTDLHQIDPRLADINIANKMTRYGSNSIEEFYESMRKIEPAAKAAKIGIEDMTAQMDQAGEMAKDAGGNYRYGFDAAGGFANRMGMPAEVFNDLTQNPIIQGRTFGMTGLPDFMQGTLPPGVKEYVTMESFNQTLDSMGSYGPQEFTLPSGETIKIDKKDVRAAMIKQAFPQLSTREIKNLSNPRKMKNYMNSLKTDVRADEVMNLLGKNPRKAMRRSGSLAGLMENSLDASGNEIFSEENIETVKGAGGAVNDIGFGPNGVNIDALRNSDLIGDDLNSDGKKLYDFLTKGGLKRKDGEGHDEFMERVLNADPTLKNKYIASQRAGAVKKINDSVERRQKEQARTRSGITLDLTPQAKKWLRQVEPGSIAKDMANAGQSALVNSIPVIGPGLAALDINPFE